MNRRSFIARVLSAVAAGAVLDVDKLLWMPGAKKIFVPAVPMESPFLLPNFQLGDVFTIQGLRGQFLVTDTMSHSLVSKLRRNPLAKLPGNAYAQIVCPHNPTLAQRLASGKLL